MPPVTFDANGVLLHGKVLFERHINLAEQFARNKKIAPGFIAEMISTESTRCSGSFEALSSLAPAIHDELESAYLKAVERLRDIRLGVLDALKTLPVKAFDEQAVRKAFAEPVSCQQAAEYFTRRKDSDHDVS